MKAFIERAVALLPKYGTLLLPMFMLAVVGVCNIQNVEAQKTGCGTQHPCVSIRQAANPPQLAAGTQQRSLYLIGSPNDTLGRFTRLGYDLVSTTAGAHDVPGVGSVTGFKGDCVRRSGFRGAFDLSCTSTSNSVATDSTGDAYRISSIVTESADVNQGERTSYFILSGSLPTPELVTSITLGCNSSTQTASFTQLLSSCTQANRLTGTLITSGSVTVFSFDARTRDTAGYNSADWNRDFNNYASSAANYRTFTVISAVPTSPASVSVDATSNQTRVAVTWAASTFNTPTGYTVLICPGASGTTCTTFRTTNASARTLNIPITGNFTPGNTYRIAVVGFNGSGSSQRRYSASFAPSSTPSQPANFVCTPSNGFDNGLRNGVSVSRSDGQINCSWDLPAAGTVTSYTFTSTAPAPSGVTRRLLAADTQETVLVPYDGQRATQSYTITLTPTNSQGDGPAGTQTGSVYALPPAVSTVTVTMGVTQATVNWVESQTLGNQEMFALYWGEVTTGTSCGDASDPAALTNQRFATPSSRRSSVVTGLKPLTEYCFAVRRILLTSPPRVGVAVYASSTTLDESAGAPNVPTTLLISVGELYCFEGSCTHFVVNYSWQSQTGGETAEGFEFQLLTGGVEIGDVQDVNLVLTHPQNITPGQRTGFRARAYRDVDGSRRRSAWVTQDGTYIMEAPSIMLTAGSSTVALAWTGSAGLLAAAVGWDAEFKLGTDTNWTDLAEISRPLRRYTFDNLTPSTEYNFRLRARNASHHSPFAIGTSTTIADTTDGPNAPESVTGIATYNDTLGYGAYTLAWQPPSSGNTFEGYRVTYQAGCTGNKTFTLVLVPAVLFTIPNAAPDQTHCGSVASFRTVAGDTRYSGDVMTESGYSSPPSNVVLQSIIEGFTLTWDQATALVIGTFTLETTHRGVIALTENIAGALRTLELPSLVSGDDYTYRLRAFNTIGTSKSNWSPPVTGTVIDDGADAPGAPQNPTLQIVADVNDATLANAVFNWQIGIAPAPEGFQASYQNAGQNGWTTINDDIGPTLTMVEVTQLTAGVSYVFRVRAFREVNGQNRYSAYALASGSIAGVRARPIDCSVAARAISTGVNTAPRVGIDLAWTNPSVATPGSELPSAMVVEWRTGDEITYRVIKLPGNAATYSVPTVLSGQRYDFRLFAEFEFGAEYSGTLVASIVADLSSGTLDCTTPELASIELLARPPEIFDVHLSRDAGDRDEIVVRWTSNENARYYELRERLGYQDSRLLAQAGISRADPVSGNSGERVGYAANGHIIPHGQYRCASGCWIGIENPVETPDGPNYQIRMSGVAYYILAMYADGANDSFYLVLQGDAFDALTSVNTDWLEWDALTVDIRVDFMTDEISQVFLEFKSDLDPAIASDIYSEEVPAGAFTFGGAGGQRTIVRWDAGGQTSEYGTIDPLFRRPRITTFKGAGIVARGTEQLAYVIHGTGSWFAVRTVLADNERSGWSAPRYYDATRSALPDVPYPDVITGETPDNGFEPEPQDFGVRAFLNAMGVGGGAFGVDGMAVGIAIGISILIGAAGYVVTPENNPQARVAIMFLLTLTMWIVTAPTIGDLPFSFVAAPVVLIIVAGMIAVFRRAG